ncbi:TsaA-like domain-containing protein, partial [Chytridium lagenaria]
MNSVWLSVGFGLGAGITLLVLRIQSNHAVDKAKNENDLHKHCKQKIYAERSGRIAAEKTIRQQVVSAMCQPEVGFPALTIGFVQSPYIGKRGTPRQGMLVSESRGFIQLHPEIPIDALQGLDGYSHVFVSFVFHENTNLPKMLSRSTRRGGSEKQALDERSKSFRTAGFSSTVPQFAAKVFPPLMNGGSIGVFATRSPHHPNPFGLSLVKIESIDVANRRIEISGLDMCEGTPILDLKPWNPADCPRCFHGLVNHDRPLTDSPFCANEALATCGGYFNVRVPEWVTAGVTQASHLPVSFDEIAYNTLMENLRKGTLQFYKAGDEERLERALTKILSLDIRSFHQGRGKKHLPESDLICQDGSQHYELDFDTLNIKFIVTDNLHINVKEVSLRIEEKKNKE